jgi:hypothetical protein
MTSVGIMASSVAALGTDVLLEPFNNFTFAPWTLNSTPTIVTGRTGTAGQFTGTLQRGSYFIAAGNRSDTLTIGFAFRKTDALTPVRTIIQLRDDTDGLTLDELKVEANGALGIYRGGTNQLGVSAAGLIVQNVWYYLEVQITLHDTLGVVTVRRNGVDVITLTGQDTNPSGGITFVYGALRLTSGVASCTNQYDDLYLTMGAGAALKGDITIP